MLALPILGKFLEKTNKTVRRPLADYVDWMHSVFTVLVLAIFAVMVGTKQHIGNPIDCMMPAEVDKVRSWHGYILDYCYIQGTKRYEQAHFQKPISESWAGVDYYQWIPLFFAFQLMCFKLPSYFWKWSQSLLYIDMDNVVTETRKLSAMMSADDRNKQVTLIADYVYNFFYYRKIARRGPLSFLLRSSMAATILYFIAKLLNLLNVLLQMYLLSVFLGFSHDWAISMLISYLTSRDKAYYQGDLALHYFPLEVKCTVDIWVDYLNQPQPKDMECLLTINYINEKLCLLLWFWFAFLALVTVVNLVSFMITYLFRTGRGATASTLVKATDVPGLLKEEPYANHFIRSFLGSDGMLIIRFMETNAGSLSAHDVLQNLWGRYRSEKGLDMMHDCLREEDWTQNSASPKSGHYSAFPMDGSGDSKGNMYDPVTEI